MDIREAEEKYPHVDLGAVRLHDFIVYLECP